MLATLIDQKKFANISVLDCVYPSKGLTPKHIDYKPRISIIIKGKLKEEACGLNVFAQCGSVVTKPADLWHKNTFGPDGCRIVSVLFENGFFEYLTNSKFCDWKWFHGAAIANTTFSFVKNLPTIAKESDLYEPIIELLTMLSLTGTSYNSDAIPSWLNLVEEKIRDEFYLPLQTKDLAKWMSVHPVYLARVFRRHYGCSVKTFLQQLRLQKAIQELSSSKKPLVDIALDAGFADQSHLSRELKKAFQMSPGLFRKWTSKVSFVQD